MQQLTALYTRFTGHSPKGAEPINGSGSNRQYVRFTDADGKSLIGVIGTSLEENHAFITLARHFRDKGLAVPQVLAVSDDERRYLQEDLGARSLFDALRPAREAGGCYGQEERLLLRRTLAALPRLQILGAQGLDFAVCYPQPELDEMNVLFDLNYFKYCFLKTTGLDFHEVRLEHDFHSLARDLLCSASPAAPPALPSSPVSPASSAVPPSTSSSPVPPASPSVLSVAMSSQLPSPPPTFLYRDFQARNIMLDAAGQPHFIDFQGGRRGPIYYDLASFLWQASARYPQELREELIAVYLSSLRAVLAEQGLPLSLLPDEGTFRCRLRRFVLFRLLQVLGAYGFRGYFERKQHFIDSIPPALQNLRELLAQDGACPYPELRGVLEKLLDSQLQNAPVSPSPLPVLGESNVSSSRAKAGTDSLVSREVTECLVNSEQPESQVTTPSLTGKAGGGSSLRVRIFSFSYKRGIPADESGNGGGYVFDCRSTHNPGRYEPYKQLTGLDEPVIRFLEDDGEILTFLQSVYRLADAHVERYIQRGFTDLMFSFGCTGGQHRSVYCAQHLAQHLHKKYSITVDLTHREQGIHTLFTADVPARP